MKLLHKVPSNYKVWRYPLILKIRYGLSSICHKDAICIKYWINSRIFLWTFHVPHYNWGDFINLPFANLLSNKVIIPHLFCAKPSIAMIGSILPWAMTKDTIVWGSGCLNSKDSSWDNVECPKKVCAVRGPLTRKVLLEHGIECPEIYGDPAMLLPKYYHPQTIKHYKFGIIFHASSLRVGEEWLQSSKLDSVLWINPCKYSHWHDFIDSICSCEIILSSSLHGIIIADAYKIPNIWITLTHQEHPDDNFKFKDYFLSVGKDIKEPLSLENLMSDNITQYMKTWQPPSIDIEKLIASCPFEIIH
ncbi:MAG: polysaccharide pyruvyl transferase family protein [Paludibacteraceae bacterium]|nr:polysaccharide pyruvyl transferase family protein [Paludibacteraceae bacterium]